MNNSKWMEVYNKGKSLGIDKYVDESFSWMQVDEIVKGLQDGVDVTTYANKYLTVKQMSDIRRDNVEDMAESRDVTVRVVDDSDLEIYYKDRLIYSDRGWIDSFGTYIVRRVPIDIEGGYFTRQSGKTFDEWLELNEDWACMMFEENEIHPNPELYMQLYLGLQEWDFIED